MARKRHLGKYSAITIMANQFMVIDAEKTATTVDTRYIINMDKIESFVKLNKDWGMIMCGDIFFDNIPIHILNNLYANNYIKLGKSDMFIKESSVIDFEVFEYLKPATANAYFNSETATGIKIKCQMENYDIKEEDIVADLVQIFTTKQYPRDDRLSSTNNFHDPKTTMVFNELKDGFGIDNKWLYIECLYKSINICNIVDKESNNIKYFIGDEDSTILTKTMVDPNQIYSLLEKVEISALITDELTQTKSSTKLPRIKI